VHTLRFRRDVVNVGLNGVLVTENQTSRTFTLRAEDWAKPIEQPIDLGSPVSLDYFDRGQFPFNGKIENITVKLS
jgi:hypothetical protein